MLPLHQRRVSLRNEDEIYLIGLLDFIQRGFFTTGNLIDPKSFYNHAIKEFVQYSTHDNFAAFIIDGSQHGFINKQMFFTIGTKGQGNVERNERIESSLLQFMKKIVNQDKTFLLSECNGKVVGVSDEKLISIVQCADLK